MNTARAPEGAKIGWIGLGKMGLPICERLAAHAFTVTALTRSAGHRERAARAGIHSASAIAGAVDGAGIVVSAISDDAALLDIVFKAGGLKETLTASQTFVEISTVSPNASRRVAEAMAAIGVDYVRSPVSGSTALAAQGNLTAVVRSYPQLLCFGTGIMIRRRITFAIGFALIFLLAVFVDTSGLLTGIPHASPLRVLAFLCIAVGLWLVIAGKF
jgi:hypothetical protein